MTLIIFFRPAQGSGAIRMDGSGGGGAPLVYRVVGGSKGRPKAEPETGQRRGAHNGINTQDAVTNNDHWRKYTDVGCKKINIFVVINLYK